MDVTRTFDANLELKDAGALTASAACQVDGVAKIIDLGAAPAYGDIIIDVSACEVDSDDERYDIGAQISSSSSFASDIYEVTRLSLGAAGTAAGDNLAGDTDMATGRWVLPFTNQISEGTPKRYMRLYVTIAGTMKTGINFTAYLVRKSG